MCRKRDIGGISGGFFGKQADFKSKISMLLLIENSLLRYYIFALLLNS